MLAVYSLFQIPINANIIAAFLTILGYSINATIVEMCIRDRPSGTARISHCGICPRRR